MQVASGWSVRVDRGPDWLFVHLQCDDALASEPTELAENLWELLKCHRGNRMVIDLGGVDHVTSALLGELVLLNKRVHQVEGLLRLCDVNEDGQASMRAARLDRIFPCYADCDAAVRGDRPPQPR